MGRSAMWSHDEFPRTTWISSPEAHLGQAGGELPRCPHVSGSSIRRLPPAGAGAYLHAVPLHRPSQGVHSLPANQDAQVDQQHAPDNHQQFLVLDDLQRGQEQKGAVREGFPDGS